MYFRIQWLILTLLHQQILDPRLLSKLDETLSSVQGLRRHQLENVLQLVAVLDVLVPAKQLVVVYVSYRMLLLAHHLQAHHFGRLIQHQYAYLEMLSFPEHARLIIRRKGLLIPATPGNSH